MMNAMTVDLEDWYHSIDSIPPEDWGKYESRLEANTEKVLELFERFGLRATFFVLGDAVQKYPELVRKIHAAGHEIATHGYGHRLVYRQSPDEFRSDLRKSLQIIEDLIGTKVLGYRAPYWTITKDSYWALEVLREEGIRYDSSIYPIKTYLYGIPDAPRFPYEVRGQAGSLIEVPPSTVTILGKKVPFSGGFYLRALPTWFILYGMGRINREGQPTVVYIHPPEFDAQKPRIELPLMERILHYHGLGVIEAKLEAMLSRFQFTTIRDLLKL
jgi:polysaccharide deacetylase family protein (PEP-CTERM system associated)